MEPSQDLASPGEFNGSESGWTTYIGSPFYNETNETCNVKKQRVDMEEYGNYYKNAHGNVDDEDDKVENDYDSNKDADDEESDDSMASDASSGPSHLQLVRIKSEESHGLDYSEHAKNNHEKILSAKRTTKQVRKTRYEGMVEKEEDSLLVTDSAASHV